jgi:hypothetical protein
VGGTHLGGELASLAGDGAGLHGALALEFRESLLVVGEITLDALPVAREVTDLHLRRTQLLALAVLLATGRVELGLQRLDAPTQCLEAAQTTTLASIPKSSSDQRARGAALGDETGCDGIGMALARRLYAGPG